MMLCGNKYSIWTKPQLARHTLRMSNEQILPFYAFPASLFIFFSLFFARPLYFLPSAPATIERPCIQRFIGCYKYIIRDKYVPSSFQSVCRSPSILLPPHLPSYILLITTNPCWRTKRTSIRSWKKWLAIKAFSALLHICWVLDASSFQLGWGVLREGGSRWNALVDWHWMLRLIGLIYCHPVWAWHQV